MSDFCKFNDIYERINILEESVSKNFPGLKASWGKAAKEARNIGASAPTREAKSIILNIVVGLMSKRLGRELTAQEERDLLRFRNIPSQKPLVDFLQTQELDGHTYASVINDASPADIDEAAEGTGISNPVEFQVGQRTDKRKEAYQDRVDAREEAKKLADAAEEGGDEELANSLDEVGDYIVNFAKGVTETEGEALDFDDLDITFPGGLDNKSEVVSKLIEIMKDAGYTAEVTPAGLNAEAPVGTFGSQDKAEDLVKGLIMKLFPNVKEDQVEVLLNTDAAVEDAEDAEGHAMSFSDKIRNQLTTGAMVLVNTQWFAVEDVDGDTVFATDHDGGEHEINIHDIETVDTAGAEDEEGVSIWSLSPEQVGKLAEHMGLDSSIQNVGALIETMAQDISPDDVEHMLSDEASNLFRDKVVTESYTSQYVVGLPVKSEVKQEPIVESVSFKERFKPKTIEQLRELRRYGL